MKGRGIKPKTIMIDEVEYIRKDSVTEQACTLKDLTLCIIRTYSAGVWYAYTDYEAENTFSNVIIKKAKRIYRWGGAFTLSEIALNGIASNSKVAQEIAELKINRVLELIPVSAKAKNVIESIKTYEV